jgi:hypothetical protein
MRKFSVLLAGLLVFLLSSAFWSVDSGIQKRRPPARKARTTAPKPAWRMLEEIGKGTAVVFSPDLARPANAKFYRGLGFFYIETADWLEAIEQILAYNQEGAGQPIQTVIMETHGNQGHGLKLQTGKDPGENRSYISLGAIQELLAGSGVRHCILTACNSGRLLRPSIYYKLDQTELLPASYGVINASPGYDAKTSDVRLLRRRESKLEMVNTVLVSELPGSVRDYLGLNDLQIHFVLSDLFMQYVLRDPRMHLTDIGYTNRFSKDAPTPNQSENLISKFLSVLDQVAANQDSNSIDRTAEEELRDSLSPAAPGQALNEGSETGTRPAASSGRQKRGRR